MEKLGSCPNNFQNNSTRSLFWIMVSNLIFWTNFTRDFPVKNEDNFYWRFSRKIEGEFWIFYKRFPWEKNWMEEIFKGISLKNWSWIHTRASLARAVFSFKTFFDCEWRSHLPSPTTSTSWTGKRAKRVLVDSGGTECTTLQS